MSLFKQIKTWFQCLFRKHWRVVRIDGDEMPKALPARTLVVLVDDGDPWSAGMMCPCGCERVLEVMLLPGVKPRWDVEVNAKGQPSLRPSVWVADGCRAHFWLRNGRVHWC